MIHGDKHTHRRLSSSPSPSRPALPIGTKAAAPSDPAAMDDDMHATDACFSLRQAVAPVSPPPPPRSAGDGQGVGIPQGAMGGQGPPQSPSSYIVKKILRQEVPTDTYPNFNFIGRLLRPRGKSLKRIEACTNCRVFIRGKGSIKDSSKKEQLKGRLGYEHLSNPLHILIEAELPANVIDAKLAKAQEILEELLKPAEDSQDYYKRQQLRELAMLNSYVREESRHPSGAPPSPFQ